MAAAAGEAAARLQGASLAGDAAGSAAGRHDSSAAAAVGGRQTLNPKELVPQAPLRPPPPAWTLCSITNHQGM